MQFSMNHELAFAAEHRSDDNQNSRSVCFQTMGRDMRWAFGGRGAAPGPRQGVTPWNPLRVVRGRKAPAAKRLVGGGERD